MKKRDTTIYCAVFQNLKLTAFGIDQVIDYKALVEIYQARANPELWRARPTFSRNLHKWEACSAEALQALIAADFEQQLEPWRVHRYTGARIDRPVLSDYTQAERRRVG